MKKFLTLLTILLALTLTACGSTPVEKSEIRLGIIKHLNITETLLDNYFEKAAARMPQTSRMYAPKHIFFHNMSTMIAALKSGQIDALSTYRNVSKYLTASNPYLKIVTEGVPKVSDSFCCAMRESDVELRENFNRAIDSMKADGTLDKLVKEYITDVKLDNIPAVEMPHFDGAQTIKVAVTGDLPPLDLILPDGQPAGFNTALLAAVSEKIGTNFELINVDSGARAVALTSKQVDVIFWVAVPQNSTLAPPDCYTPPGVILTNPYFTDEIVHVEMTK